MEARSPGGTFTLQWHITHRCNLRCAHCYQEDFAAFESEDAAAGVIGQYRELLSRLGMRGCLTVTGGEPLLHPGLFAILDLARESGLETAVLTNGTLVGRREARLLRACGVSYVQVSLDGMKEVHDAIRAPGSFDAAMEGIRWLRSEGIYTTVSFTAQQANVAEFAKLARHCRSIGVDKLWFDRVVLPANGDRDGLSLTSAESSRLFRRAARLSRKTPTVCIRSLQFLECDSAPVYRCTAGKSLLAVLANGDVMACRRLPIVLGNLGNRSLSEIYHDSPVTIALREDGPPAACAACQHVDECGGGAKCIAFAQLGDFTAADPDCPLHG